MFFTGTIAVVGATNDTSRPAFAVYKKLKERFPKRNVYPVHLHETSVQGDIAYVDITDIPEPIDTLVLIINPQASLHVVKTALTLGVKKFWFQPGSFDETIIELLKNERVETSYGACILHF